AGDDGSAADAGRARDVGDVQRDRGADARGALRRAAVRRRARVGVGAGAQSNAAAADDRDAVDDGHGVGVRDVDRDGRRHGDRVVLAVAVVVGRFGLRRLLVADAAAFLVAGEVALRLGLIVDFLVVGAGAVVVFLGALRGGLGARTARVRAERGQQHGAARRREVALQLRRDVVVRDAETERSADGRARALGVAVGLRARVAVEHSFDLEIAGDRRRGREPVGRAD